LKIIEPWGIAKIYLHRSYMGPEAHPQKNPRKYEPHGWYMGRTIHGWYWYCLGKGPSNNQV